MSPCSRVGCINVGACVCFAHLVPGICLYNVLPFMGASSCGCFVYVCALSSCCVKVRYIVSDVLQCGAVPPCVARHDTSGGSFSLVALPLFAVRTSTNLRQLLSRIGTPRARAQWCVSRVLTERIPRVQDRESETPLIVGYTQSRIYVYIYIAPQHMSLPDQQNSGEIPSVTLGLHTVLNVR